MLYTPETDSCCKICMCRQYDLSCKGREHCGIHADISGTLAGIRERCQDVFGRPMREELAKAEAKKAAEKKQAAFDAAARAYNRGEGFIQFSPILGFSCFTYEGHDWNLNAVSQRAYELK